MEPQEEKNIALPLATAFGRAENHNHNIAVYGDHGSGKTSWVEEILVSKKKRLFIVDTTGHDYGEEKFCAACHIDYDAVITDIRQIKNFVSRDSFRVVIRCHGNEMQVLNIFKWDVEKKSALVTDCTIVVEEIHRFMDSKNIEPELEDIVVLGRHSRNNFIGVSQIPRGQTNPLYRSQMDMFVSFRQTEESAIKFFNDFDSVKAEKLRGFGRGEYDLFRGTNSELVNFIESD
jgi:hypothetical protein